MYPTFSARPCSKATKARSRRRSSTRRAPRSSLQVSTTQRGYGRLNPANCFRPYRVTRIKSSRVSSTTRAIPSSRVPRTTRAGFGGMWSVSRRERARNDDNYCTFLSIIHRWVVWQKKRGKPHNKRQKRKGWRREYAEKATRRMMLL